MRWWLNTDHKAFSVDNASVSGSMDFSGLPPDLWMVQWTDGRGEIEYQADDGTNLNGLRDDFYDLTPYCPLFQQFLVRLPGLTLPQAKKVQCELIAELYDCKRQLPYPQPVTAGNFTWPADDGAVAAMSCKAIPVMLAGTNNYLIDSINGLIDAINNRITGFNGNDSNIITQTNNAVVTPGNAVVTSLNTLIGAINGNVINEAAGFDTIDVVFGQVNSQCVVPGNAAITHINNLLGVFNNDQVTNTINNMLRGFAVDTPTENVVVARPGLNAQLGHITASFSYVGSNPYRPVQIAITYFGFSALSAPAAVPPISHLGYPTAPSGVIPWTPIEQSEPVDLSSTEVATIMAGIATRRENLLQIKTDKTNAVNALTTIPAVIAFDVATGW